MKKRRFVFLLVLCMLFWGLAGCGEETADDAVEKIDYTVVDPEDIPEELLAQMEESKENGFKLTYLAEEGLYIAKGYGRQETGGYSVTVKELFLGGDTVTFAAELMGPKSGEIVSEAPSYPYIVVKVEYREQNVVFK